MASPKEYFEKDASANLRVHAIHTFQDSRTDEKIEVIASVAFDFDAGVRFALVYVPDSHMATFAISHYLKDIDKVLKIGDGLETRTGFYGTDEQISSKDLDFSRRIFAYTPTRLSLEEK
jgi:hypothetical protein